MAPDISVNYLFQKRYLDGSFCSFNGTLLYIGNGALQLNQDANLTSPVRIKAKLQDMRNPEMSVRNLA
jgi:hypothetical protein